jgi:acetylornithine deacetylase
MVRIDSTNPDLVPGGAGEGQMAAYLAELCTQLGLEVTLQEVASPERANVIARWKGTGKGKSLLLTGHTDIVGTTGMTIAPFEPHVLENRLFGRGALDMKGGLASILGAVKALKEAGFQPTGDLILGFVVDEEHASLGTQALISEVGAQSAILVEPTGLDVCIAHRGFVWLEITTHGRAEHGSLYDSGIDAIAQMGKVLQVMRELERDIYPRKTHPLLGRASVHASLIEGGLGLSTYPDRCSLKIEHRLLPVESAQDVLRSSAPGWRIFPARTNISVPTLSCCSKGRPLSSPTADVTGLLLQQMNGEFRRSRASRWLDSAFAGQASIRHLVRARSAYRS